MTQIILAAPQVLGGQAESHGGAAFDVAGFDGDDPAAGDTVVRAQTQPGGKTFGGGKTGDEVRTQFGEEHEARVDLDAGHLGEVDAAEAIEFGAGVKGRFVALRFFVLEPGGGERVLA